uniref:Uncharacterized protein n=1 Tax=Vespula pensylvanica TaxID=30213 RepID=A0A834PCP4_VESPE|nr:hypothetical protein H0235_003861 [Vespula pensylvanica]
MRREDDAKEKEKDIVLMVVLVLVLGVGVSSIRTKQLYFPVGTSRNTAAISRKGIDNAVRRRRKDEL